jgi:hypothetical protein
MSKLTRSEIGMIDENKITNRNRVSTHVPPPPFSAVITPLRTKLMMNSNLALALISSSQAPANQRFKKVSGCKFNTGLRL